MRTLSLLAPALVPAVALAGTLPIAPRSPVPVPVEHGWQHSSRALEPPASARLERRQSWSLSQPGVTGVGAMQLVVVSPTQVLIVDKAEKNNFTINGHDAWSAIYGLNTNTPRPVDLISNSFCAGGSFFGNGTLGNVGGNGAVDNPGIPDTYGMQGMRLFTPSQCADSAPTCSFYESVDRVRLASARWYPTAVTVDDGSLLIVGGTKSGGFLNSNSSATNSYEFYPPKNINGFNGFTIPSNFLQNTLNANLFPIAMVLPGGKLFVAANTGAITYDWRNNIETALPAIPNGVRFTYPMSGVAVLLPLTPANSYTPTVLICGGSTSSDQVDPATLSAEDPASSQCARMDITTAGIAAGWAVEQMPVARIMPDAVILPTGQILIINGGKTGYAGYGNVKQEVGQSNADNPVFQGVLYNPIAPAGSRFSSTGLPTSTIARLYHSVASVAPDGSVIVAGSNPNADVSTIKYATEYRLEIFGPPYMAQSRPTFTGLPSNLLYGSSVLLNVVVPSSPAKITVALMNLGYSTHAVHMNMRLLGLASVFTPSTGALNITMPNDPTLYPPGPAFLYVLANNVPSKGQWVMVGTGANPPFDLGAYNNMILHSHNP